MHIRTRLAAALLSWLALGAFGASAQAKAKEPSPPPAAKDKKKPSGTITAVPVKPLELSDVDAAPPPPLVTGAPAAPRPAGVVAENQAPAAVERGLWRVFVAGGLDLSTAGVGAAGAAFLGVRRSLVSTSDFDGLVGLRASYAPRSRDESLLVPGRGLDPQSRLLLNTGDVVATFTAEFSPFSSKRLAVDLEAGLGLGWRTGDYSVLGQTQHLSGVGPAAHLAAGLTYSIVPLLRAGLRLESSFQPLASNPEQPALPSNLGATRCLAQLLFVL